MGYSNAFGNTEFRKAIAQMLNFKRGMNISPDQITLESAYFLNVATVSSDNNNLTVYTLLKKTLTNTLMQLQAKLLYLMRWLRY